MNETNKSINILKARHAPLGIFRFMTRSWAPKKILVSDKMYTPKDLKDLVAKSVFMDTYLEAESTRQGVSVEVLKKEMLQYLDEIAFERKTHVVRWMGIAFLKICFMMKISVFVNEPVVLKLRDSMGNSPVLFLPTHRSYADFCLMTYLCYHYDIDIPAVAAGMDFHSMAVLGQRMREMCAFYIRRSLVGAPLYAATLKQYVRTMVVNHSAPIEFFLEGTRSRMNMSHYPRTGMLSMTLTPYFAREVGDITVVPVNISYDRLVESILFVYEHLGVPKPRESTEGLFKSLQSLRDDYGHIYVTLGTPISLNEFFKRDASSSEKKGEGSSSGEKEGIPSSGEKEGIPSNGEKGDGSSIGESLKPVDLQTLTDEQTTMVKDLADHVISVQQECTTVTVTNLLAIVLMQSLMKNSLLHLDEVVSEVEWVAGVLAARGANVAHEGRGDVERALHVQRHIFMIDKRKHLRLLRAPSFTVFHPDPRISYTLRPETKRTAVPVIELQLYVNPALHYLVPPAFLYLLVKGGITDSAVCYKKYRLLRSWFRFVFFYSVKENDAKYQYKKAMEYCHHNRVIRMLGGKLVPGDNERLQYLFQWTMLPAFTTMAHCAEVMDEEARCGRARAAHNVQALGQARMTHPATLSRVAAALALDSLAAAGPLRRDIREKETIYETNPNELQQCRELLDAVLPRLNEEIWSGNSVFRRGRPVASRL